MSKKKIIGITGGVGAGKSSVLRILQDCFDAKVILADLVAHDLMEPGTEGLEAVVHALGDSFILADGSVDRKALAEIIFHDENALQTMNSIIHPLVWQWIENEANTCAESLVVIEAAVFDTAPDGLFDEIWYVYAADDVRIERLMASRGYTKEKCESIMKKQNSDESFRKICSFVIDNNGSEEETKKQLEEKLVHEIR